jgi:hypothetical protein
MHTSSPPLQSENEGKREGMRINEHIFDMRDISVPRTYSRLSSATNV